MGVGADWGGRHGKCGISTMNTEGQGSNEVYDAMKRIS